MNEFMTDLGWLDGPVAYEKVVATQFCNWKGCLQRVQTLLRKLPPSAVAAEHVYQVWACRKFSVCHALLVVQQVLEAAWYRNVAYARTRSPTSPAP